MSKFIAIDLDPQGVFAVAGTARGGHAKIEQAVAWDGTDGDPPPALTPETAQQVGEKLRERLKSAGVVQSPVLVSIPRDRVILKELRYPVVPPSEEPNVVKFQAMKELTDSPEELVIDYVQLSSGGAPDGEQRSMAVAVRKDLFVAIQRMCAAANVRLAAVTPRPYAVAAGLARAFALGTVPRPEHATDAVATLTLGPGGGDFTIVRKGAVQASPEVIFTRTVPGPVVASETMLIAEVRRNLTMYAGANPDHPIRVLYVAEGGEKWANRLRSAVGIPVKSYDPLGHDVPAIPEPTRGRFAGAVGLLEARSADAIPINFATPRAPKVVKDVKQGKLLIAAGLTALILLAGAVMGWVVLDAKDKELDLLKKQKTSLEAEIARLEPDAKRVDAATNWRKRQVVWLDMLFDWTDDAHASGGFLAAGISGRLSPPDPKTGKQKMQATAEIRLSSRSPDPVNGFMSALNRDNPKPSNKKEPEKYYEYVDKNIKGLSSSNDPGSIDYVITARVGGRPNDKFTHFPSFVSPSRWNYPPPVAKAPERKESEKKEKEKDKEDRTAPSPKRKPSASEE